MSENISLPPENRLLQALSESDYALLKPKLERVDLPVRQLLEAAHHSIHFIYFIEAGIASMVAKTPAGREAEVGMVGREGMTGSSLLQGDDQAAFDTFMQIAGVGLRITAADLTEALETSAALRTLLISFARTLAIQSSYTALANGHSKLEERLARWLLMTHDRVAGDRMELTHEFLALMLAVRRPGVTVALHLLEGKGLIRSHRGEVIIRDREGLIALSDGVYGLPEQEYVRLIGTGLAQHRAERAPSLAHDQ